MMSNRSHSTPIDTSEMAVKKVAKSKVAKAAKSLRHIELPLPRIQTGERRSLTNFGTSPWL